MAKDRKLLKSREIAISNLMALKTLLSDCVEEGLMDEDAHFYNELLDLIDDAELIATWDDLEEVIALAKTLEIDVDSWLSRKGRTSLSLEWPTKG